MSIIPAVTPRQILSALLKAWFQIIRQKGSHIRLEHPISGKSTTVALHVKGISRKMTSIILKQAGVSVKDFIKFIKK